MTTVLEAMGLEDEIRDWKCEMIYDSEQQIVKSIRFVNEKRDITTCVVHDVALEYLPLITAGFIGDIREAVGITRLSSACEQPNDKD
jgi:hypothetical protein